MLKIFYVYVKNKMSNVSLNQLIILLIIGFLLFGDIPKLKNKINLFFMKSNSKKNRKKGT